MLQDIQREDPVRVIETLVKHMKCTRNVLLALLYFLKVFALCPLPVCLQGQGFALSVTLAIE